ncbi:MAG: glycosyltransferase [Ruminococcus sp.]|nr:glycosyltransferase [Ruminococcus sp.]
MKILYLGTVCDFDKYEQLLKKCKTKPSVASVVFETAMMKGFAENGSDVQILSYPMIPTFPNSRSLFFGGHTENLCGFPCRWLKTLNLPFVKQWSRRADARRAMKAWAKENRGDGVILTYSVPPFLIKDILQFSKRYELKAVAAIPDLLANMYINHKGCALVNSLKQLYLNRALKLQGEYDGYVYLTEAMREVVSLEKPYIVMEGILDRTDAAKEKTSVSSPRVIMYAGGMHEKYGVLNLLDAFEQIEDTSAELWLFGEGTAVSEIQHRAKNNPRIRYFGSVKREEVLEYERKASLLVNPRSTKEGFTKYSFPSKTIEYMASGTPLLTTKLEGIPQEYSDYVFTVRDNDAVLLKEALNKALSLSDAELKSKGKAAQKFVYEHKNAKSQVGRIIKFLEKLSGEDHGVNVKEKI